MRKTVLLAMPLVALAGLGAAQAADEGGVLYVRDAMRGAINSATVDLWDVGNEAMSDDGGIDPALMTDETWAKLEQAAELLAAESNAMAEAGTIKAAIAEEADDEEPGTFSMADVQSYIDADPEAFRALSAALGIHASDIAAAARARDAKRAGDLVSELDQVCEACHARYWYPQG